MPLQIIRADITKLKVDAIVNAANHTLLGGGGVDGAIHRAAGPKLLEECRTLGGCRTGEAKITKGYDLPAKYVIHTVGPVWGDGTNGEPELLASAYRSSLELADANHCETVAFPLISAGAYGCPKKTAFSIAVHTIGEYVLEHDLDVSLVIYDRASFDVGSSWGGGLQAFIDDAYVEAHRIPGEANRRYQAYPMSQMSYAPAPAKKKKGILPSFGTPGRKRKEKKEKAEEEISSYPGDLFEAEYTQALEAEEASDMALNMPAMSQAAYGAVRPDDLESRLKNLDASFSQRLLRMIDERGIKDSDCYKKANITRQHFSKIRNDDHYRPKKTTVLAFCVALELSLPETRAFLESAGYALSHASIADVIVEYFINNRQYNIFDINAALFEYDQNLLGS